MTGITCNAASEAWWRTEEGTRLLRKELQTRVAGIADPPVIAQPVIEHHESKCKQNGYKRA